jgi:hypothetical protein
MYRVKGSSVMKEPRVEKLVTELKYTVDRLNRLNALLVKTDTTFTLHRSTRTDSFELIDITQKVDY